jgi:hypothetical protein
MKAYGAVDVYIYIFLTSTLVGGEWSASRPGRSTPGERAPGTHWIGGWVSPRTGLDDVERKKISLLLGLEMRPPSAVQPIASRYPGSPSTGNFSGSFPSDLIIVKLFTYMSLNKMTSPFGTIAPF